MHMDEGGREGENTRKRNRSMLIGGRGRRTGREADRRRQAAIYFHPNLNSIFARSLSLSLSLAHSEILENEAVSVPPYVKRGGASRRGRRGTNGGKSVLSRRRTRDQTISKRGRASERASERGNNREEGERRRR